MSAEPPLRWRVTEHAFPSAAAKAGADPDRDPGAAADAGPETIRTLHVPPGFDVVGAIDGELVASRRGDGWTAEKQRDFLAALAAGETVDRACRSVGMTHQSAYAFRASAAGSAFAIGWHAAQLLQRQRLADTLMARAIEGQREWTNEEGRVTDRFRYDNRLGLALLARLDRVAEAGRSGEEQAARLVARDWERWLELVGGDAGPARAGLFLAARAEAAEDEASAAAALAPLVTLARADLHARTGATDAGEIDTSDLDPAQRGHWSAEQWARAEAAGLLRLAAPPAEPTAAAPAAEDAADDATGPQLPQHSPIEDHVWFDHDDQWRTDFPPPPDFDGEEDGLPGEEGYSRTLSDEEEALIEAVHHASLAGVVSEGEAARRAWLEAMAAELAGYGAAAGGGSGMEPGGDGVVGENRRNAYPTEN